jgi:plastocyanin
MQILLRLHKSASPIQDRPRRLLLIMCLQSERSGSWSCGGMHMRGWSLLGGVSLVCLLIGCGGGSGTPTSPSTGGNSVTVGNNFYSPISLTVPANTTVTWTWANGATQHNVTFDDPGGPASPTQSSGTFQRTFTTPGTYPYHCTIHGAAVMHGTVTVPSASAGTGAGTGMGGTSGGAAGGGGYSMP